MITTQYLKFNDRAEELAYLQELRGILLIGIAQGDPTGAMANALASVEQRYQTLQEQGAIRLDPFPDLRGVV